MQCVKRHTEVFQLDPKTDEMTEQEGTRKAWDCLKGEVMTTSAASDRRRVAQTSWCAVTDGEVLRYLGWNRFLSSGEAQCLCESYPECTDCVCCHLPPSVCLDCSSRRTEGWYCPGKAQQYPTWQSALCPISMSLLGKFLLKHIWLPVSVRQSPGIAGLLCDTAAPLICLPRDEDTSLAQDSWEHTWVLNPTHPQPQLQS